MSSDQFCNHDNPPDSQGPPVTNAPVGETTKQEIINLSNQNKPIWRSIFEVAISVLTVVIIGLQCFILYRQTTIMREQTTLTNEQTKIMGQQAVFIENQYKMTVRPRIYTEVKNLIGPWLIKNEGADRIKNLRINVLHFKKYENRGWMASQPLGGTSRKELLSGEIWSVNIDMFGKMFEGTDPKSLSPIEGLEFIVCLLFFERNVDNKQYVYLEPFSVDKAGKLWWLSNVAMSGPLAKFCNPPIELAYELFKRQPFGTNFEIYNYNYLLGYVPTGCLGPIQWISN